MTLIVSLMTDRFVALVSDMRVTWIQGGRVTAIQDTDVKAFLIADRFLMGFTGVARIDGLRTEAWVADLVKNVRPTEYFRAIATGTQALFNRFKLQGQPHSFLAVGYANRSSDGRLVPCRILVTNHPATVGFGADTRNLCDDFVVRAEQLGNRRWSLATVGAHVPRKAEAELSRFLRPLVKHEVTPLRTVDSLVQLVDFVAERDVTVGSQQIIATMARAAVPTASCAIPFTAEAALTASRDDVVCLNVPDKANRWVQPIVAYGPAIISDGFQMIGSQVMTGTTDFIGPTKGYCR